jgi:hypothetical protein
MVDSLFSEVARRLINSKKDQPFHEWSFSEEQDGRAMLPCHLADKRSLPQSGQ